MKPPKYHPQSGFTLLEVIIASAILGGLSLLIGYTVLRINSGTSVILNSQGAKAQSRIVFESLAQRIFNTIRSAPVEDLFSTNPRDLKYKGIYGFRTGEAYPWTSCRVEAGKYSLVRLTSIIPKTKTESTLRLWRENQASTSKLRLSRTIESEDEIEDEISGVINGPETVDALGRRLTPLKSSVTEILVIDGDSLAQRRYKVTALRKVITTRDPNSDIAPSPITQTSPIYTYTELTLAQPQLVNGGVPRAETSTFISGSTVYAVRTSVLCIQGNKLVEVIENPAQGEPGSTVLFDSDQSQLAIARFEVTYGSSTSSLGEITFSEFPSSVGGSGGIGCINVVRLLLELRPTSSAMSSNIFLKKQILLGNHNEGRPQVCL